MVGNVFYIYHLGECWKWNVETNQVELLFRDIACYRMLGAVYCDMQYVITFDLWAVAHIATNHNSHSV